MIENYSRLATQIASQFALTGRTTSGYVASLRYTQISQSETSHIPRTLCEIMPRGMKHGTNTYAFYLFPNCNTTSQY